VIALVRGEVVVRRPEGVVVLAGGVGYRLAVSGETLRRVPAVGEQVTLHAHLAVREDALELFGFATEEERELFELLIGVQSVGPKVALAVLSGGTPREVAAALGRGDVARLQLAPGVGKRTAQRLVAELAERVGFAAGPGAAGADAAAGASVVTAPDDPRALARDGLVELGFSPVEAEGLLREARGEAAEELMAQALRGTRAA
jgi:Holliday junction DNA helicase RuvA